MSIATTKGDPIHFGERSLGGALVGFSGELIGPGDAEYEAARRVWNGLIDRRPGLIARCRTEADVISAVNLAREHRLLVSIRGGGHQVAGTAVCDGGLVLDLSSMKRIDVNAPARSVRAESGVRWGELDRSTQAFGLATTGGEVSTTGIAGLTLGGGLGMLQRRFGLTCDNLQSVRLVTADGQLRIANAASNPDLFWAVRGGGRGIGVVTSFEYRLHEIGPEVMVSTVFYPFERAQDVLCAWLDFTKRAPDEVTSQLLLWTVAPHPVMPVELHGRQVIAVIGLYAGPVEPGRAALRPLATLAEPIADLSGRTPYLELQSGLDDMAPAGGRYYWKSLFFDQLGNEAVDEIVACAGQRPSPATLVVLRHLGGAIARIPEDRTAYANRSAQYNLSLDSIWTDPRDDRRNIDWTRASWDRMRPHSTGGVYLNFAGLADEASVLLRAAHGSNYARLCEIRRRNDPDGVFAAAALDRG